MDNIDTLTVALKALSEIENPVGHFINNMDDSSVEINVPSAINILESYSNCKSIAIKAMTTIYATGKFNLEDLLEELFKSKALRSKMMMNFISYHEYNAFQIRSISFDLLEYNSDRTIYKFKYFDQEKIIELTQHDTSIEVLELLNYKG